MGYDAIKKKVKKAKSKSTNELDKPKHPYWNSTMITPAGTTSTQTVSYKGKPIVFDNLPVAKLNLEPIKSAIDKLNIQKQQLINGLKDVSDSGTPPWAPSPYTTPIPQHPKPAPQTMAELYKGTSFDPENAEFGKLRDLTSGADEGPEGVGGAASPANTAQMQSIDWDKAKTKLDAYAKKYTISQAAYTAHQQQYNQLNSQLVNQSILNPYTTDLTNLTAQQYGNYIDVDGVKYQVDYSQYNHHYRITPKYKPSFLLAIEYVESLGGLENAIRVFTKVSYCTSAGGL